MPNSGLAQLGFWANFKVGFVLGSSVFNLYIWLTKSPTDAKPRDVSGKQTENRRIEELNQLKMKIRILVILIILLLLTTLFGWVFYVRIRMDYNSEGTYFDENTLVVYNEQALLVYGIITLILLTLTLLTTWKLKSVIKKRSKSKNKAL